MFCAALMLADCWRAVAIADARRSMLTWARNVQHHLHRSRSDRAIRTLAQCAGISPASTRSSGIRLRFDPERFEASSAAVRSNSAAARSCGGRGPVRDLSYVAHVNHRRARDKGLRQLCRRRLDRVAHDRLLPAHRGALSPRVEAAPESRARLVLHLPPAGTRQRSFRRMDPIATSSRHRISARPPRGWLLLGRMQRTTRTSRHRAHDRRRSGRHAKATEPCSCRRKRCRARDALRPHAVPLCSSCRPGSDVARRAER
jgi:hypothetical protein